LLYIWGDKDDRVERKTGEKEREGEGQRCERERGQAERNKREGRRETGGRTRERKGERARRRDHGETDVNHKFEKGLDLINKPINAPYIF
jgi:hypothetical protein